MPGDAPLPAPIEPIRHLLVLGTSLSENQLWPRLLADRLAKCTGILPEVEVLARAGATSSWGADVLNSRVGPHADAALVEFGVNDADWLDGLSKKRSREAHAAIFADLAGTAVVAMRMNPAYGPRGWVRMGRAAREADIAAQAIAAGAGALDLEWRWRRRWRVQNRHLEMPDGLHPAPSAAAEVIVPAAAAILAPECDEALP